MVIKHIEQTTVNQKENSLSPRQKSEGGNNRNTLRMLTLCENHALALSVVIFMNLNMFSLYILKDRMECH
jgi:hypothetical protein